MDWNSEYARWQDCPHLDAQERQELAELPQPLRPACFGAPLSFGTAGLRGRMAPGPGAMNRFTVAQAAGAFGEFLLQTQGRDALRGVALCFDTRHHSRDFALIAARELTQRGLPVQLFTHPRPTPQLSFAVRHLGLAGGINITASHNTKEFNGCKFYEPSGAQLTDAHCQQVAEHMAALPLLQPAPLGIKSLITPLDTPLDAAYLSALSAQIPPPPEEGFRPAALKIVYTPLHGVGDALLPQLFAQWGFTDLHTVPSQQQPDGDFPTVASPNPEDPQSFAQALALARHVGAQLIIATDPDADRVAFQVLHRGSYESISGHQAGCLLAHYLLTAHKARGTLPPNPTIIKSIVTTELARRIALGAGGTCTDTFTGFKHMANLAQAQQEQGSHCLLAFEEAIGAMVGSHCRDKDGLAAALVMALLAAQCQSKGETLVDCLEQLYTRHGFYQEDAISQQFMGPDAQGQMAQAMDRLRSKPPTALGELPLVARRDYLPGLCTEISTGKAEKLPLQGSDMLYYEVSGGSALAIRPSGTEPKIKCYLLALGETKPRAQRVLAQMRLALPQLLEQALPEQEGENHP